MRCPVLLLLVTRVAWGTDHYHHHHPIHHHHPNHHCQVPATISPPQVLVRVLVQLVIVLDTPQELPISCKETAPERYFTHTVLNLILIPRQPPASSTSSLRICLHPGCYILSPEKTTISSSCKNNSSGPESSRWTSGGLSTTTSSTTRFTFYIKLQNLFFKTLFRSSSSSCPKRRVRRTKVTTW